MGIKALVSMACDGDMDAFSALMDRFQDMAIGYAWSLLGDYHLAQDAAQEAFTLAYLNLARLRDPNAFAGWLRKIVFTCCTRIIRRSKPEVSLDSAEPAMDPWEPQSLLDRRLLGEEIGAAVAGLPGQLRSVLILYHRFRV